MVNQLAVNQSLPQSLLGQVGGAKVQLFRLLLTSIVLKSHLISPMRPLSLTYSR